MTKVFIDGKEGTTGLRIYDRLAADPDIELITLPEELRKDTLSRKRCLNECDIAILCLPDAAAIEAVGLIDNEHVRVIDASTAHRTAEGWLYGFKELSPSVAEKMKSARYVAVPGCHASGFVALAAPLVREGLLPSSARISAFSLTGYSGGGKKMIALYESEERSPSLSSPRPYALTQTHKHLKEMVAVCGLDAPPVFVPTVCDFYSGMEVVIPLFGMDAEAVTDVYRRAYDGSKLIRVLPANDTRFGGFIPANAMSGRDDMIIEVCGSDGRLTATALFDNLGKGASGAALQCLNVMLGRDETAGLILSGETDI